MIINWNVTAQEAATITKIVRRAIILTGIKPVDVLKLDMDLTCAHLHNGGLDLDGLLNATNGDFNHDISGIISNMDRNTGKLKNNFTPRHSRHAIHQA